MKNLKMVAMITVALALTTSDFTYGQTALNTMVEVPTIPAGKKNTPGVYNALVKKRAIIDFKKRFENVSNEKWYKTKNRYAAIFTSDELRYTVEYDHGGNWRATQKEYAEKKLPKGVREIVKSVYFDYQIMWVREINVPELFQEPVYLIHLEDDKNFKNISVCDGEMKVLEEFPKG